MLREELGYDCRQLPLEECEGRAEELARKFAAYRDRRRARRQGGSGSGFGRMSAIAPLHEPPKRPAAV